MTRYRPPRPWPGRGLRSTVLQKGGMENDHPVEWEDELDNKTLIQGFPQGATERPGTLERSCVIWPAREAGFMTGQVPRLNGGMYGVKGKGFNGKEPAHHRLSKF